MVLESHFPSLFQIILAFLYTVDLSLMTRWAGLPLPLLGFGLGGWLLGHFYSCFVYHRSMDLLGFKPLVDH